jgi:hypothetical protein
MHLLRGDEWHRGYLQPLANFTMNMVESLKRDRLVLRDINPCDPGDEAVPNIPELIECGELLERQNAIIATTSQSLSSSLWWSSEPSGRGDR